jgi:hypothetical protein
MLFFQGLELIGGRLIPTDAHPVDAPAVRVIRTA